MGDEPANRSVKCPHCEKEIAFDVFLTLTPASSMRMTLHPKEGEKLSLDTIGATMENVAKLLKAIGKEQGVHVEVLLEDFKITPDGAVDFGFVVARFEKPSKLPPARKREKARA